MPRPKTYNRDDILQLAMQAFWMKGYSATSISDLVKATGINRFSLYNEFENKDALYRAALQKYQLTVMEHRMGELEQSRDGLACLRGFFADYVDGVKASLKNKTTPVSCLSLLNAVEAVGQTAEPARTMNAILTRMQTAFACVLRRAVDQGEIGPKVNIADSALFLVGSTYGLDVLCKFLSRRELTAYTNNVLSSLT